MFWGEDRVKRRVTYAELYAEVSRLAQALRAAGVKRGRPRRRLHAEHARDDHRDAGRHEPRRDLVVLLARFRRAGRARPLRPDRAEGAVRRRRLLLRRQDASTLLAAHRGDRRAAALGRTHVVVVPYTQRAAGHLPAFRARCTCTTSWRLTARRSIAFERLPFDHPLYILYSSGTTGVPKCIVHGAGGTLLQHLKEHRLHTRPQARRPAVLLHDLRLDDVELAGLAASPSARRCCSTTARRSIRDGRILFDFADAERITVFGTSAKYIDALRKAGLRAARRRTS